MRKTLAHKWIAVGVSVGQCECSRVSSSTVKRVGEASGRRARAEDSPGVMAAARPLLWWGPHLYSVRIQAGLYSFAITNSHGVLLCAATSNSLTLCCAYHQTARFDCSSDC